jgi:glycogen(starch) synthase
MRILMFGWEFPPRVSGGLGTACYGITQGIAKLGHDILFVIPGPEMTEADSRIRLISASKASLQDFAINATCPEQIMIQAVASPLRPYMNDLQYRNLVSARGAYAQDSYLAVSGGYGEDLIAEVLRYSRAGGVIAAQECFDIIHGHDWMSVHASLEARKRSGKPFVFHIHALEFDRSGDDINQQVFDIERYGMVSADAIIAVSHRTKNLIVARYGISPDKVAVVHNAVTQKTGSRVYHAEKSPSEKVVLFLGRITFQKGPDYFIEAAVRVLREMPEVTFVMAGSGDMMPRMVERVAELGIGKRFHFTGFLQNAEVEQMFARSDLYVMPSVSEPFGISPLEAVMYDVPVIISKQSGVSEILHHALTVDFWDVDELANKMIAVLKYPPLSGELAAKAKEELQAIVWEKAAAKIMAVYRQSLTMEKA